MELYAGAALSLRGRLLLSRRVVERGWSLAEAAAAAEVSDLARWVGRFAAQGQGGIARSLLGPAHGREPHAG